MSHASPWKRLLATLRAAAEPTRLRLLALAGRGAFCVIRVHRDPRPVPAPPVAPSEAAVRGRAAGPGTRGRQRLVRAARRRRRGGLARDLLARLPEDDPVLEADRRQAARVLAERARIASESFRRQGADWDEMRALDLPAAGGRGHAADAGPRRGHRAGCSISAPAPGGCWNCSAPRVRAGVGVDAAQAMLALARARLTRAGLGALRGAAGRHVPPAAAGRGVRSRGGADGAALRRGSRPACWPRPRGCCAPAAP